MKTGEIFWALAPEYAQKFLESMAEPGSEKCAAKDMAKAASLIMHREGSVAVIAVSGALGRETIVSRYDDSILLTGHDAILAALKAALADLSVRAVLLSFDSPGGVVAGTKELADYIAACAKRKPMAAYCDGLCASAACWLAAACGRVFAPATAQVGSIGVIMTLADMSGYFRRLGVKIEHVASGKYKAAGRGELSDAERAYFQDKLAEIHAIFKADVASALQISAPASETHLAQADVLAPEDIQDVRAFGATELTTAASVVNDKMAVLKRNVDMTKEMHRLGAVKGIVLDADGKTELLNLFNVFGVKQKKLVITFPASAPDAENPILSAILNAKRQAQAAMGGNPYSHFEAIIGSNFYDMLTGHALVRKYFEDWLARKAGFGDNDYRKRGFTYGDITFYEASDVVGGLTLVEPDKGHLYPVGPGIFKAYNAPADWMETANTIGLPFYACMDERRMGRGFDIEVQANPLTLCIYPEALVELTAKSGS